MVSLSEHSGLLMNTEIFLKTNWNFQIAKDCIIRISLYHKHFCIN